MSLKNASLLAVVVNHSRSRPSGDDLCSERSERLARSGSSGNAVHIIPLRFWRRQRGLFLFRIPKGTGLARPVRLGRPHCGN
jgi:hypothetical protein